jgi:L-seryl-tRNA(Ser) seleniumtransferase
MQKGFYAQYGLPAVLNASGTLTMFGGCRVRPEAAKAMAQACTEFVDLDRFLESSGRRIADRLGVEAAVVTAGASPALILAAAACIAGKDPWLRNCLPSSPPGRREVVIMRCHRNPYDNAIPTAGARFVEIGDSIRTHPWELEAAIGENTAAVFYALQAQMLQASLSLDETLAIAHGKNVPVIVDAAAELPPKRNLWELARRGADLVAFSGGKEIAGPQSSGLLVGKASLIEAARFNGAPFYGAGRPVKAGKENIAGFVAALEAYLEEDEDERMALLEEIRDMWIRRLSGIPSLEAGVFTPTQPGMHPVCIPKAYARPKDPNARQAAWADALVARLRSNNPSVIVDRWNGSIILNPQTLAMDEALLVAEHIERALAP